MSRFTLLFALSLCAPFFAAPLASRAHAQTLDVAPSDATLTSSSEASPHTSASLPTHVVDPEPEPYSPPPTHVEDPEDAPPPIDERTIAGWDHFELSMGFLAGQHRLRNARWSNAATLDPSVFAGAPFDRVEAYGLRYDLRLVVAHVRMTAGVDVPFAAYDVDATRTSLEGVRTEVPELKLFGFHFGIGAEYPIGPVAPFVDVLGGLDWATADVVRGGETFRVESRDFAFRIRAGVRLHVRRWFFASASGEVGLTGQPSWAAELSVGFALMAGRDQR
jgi:hypothetical protein